ncbi:hypothetical protein C8R48DRAFT_730278 [Suillus tomentosus]|nr:hypothetical protein C8R48DRAFT_730278 [Suillus tomentosus]
MSQVSSTDDAEDQLSHNAEQPPPQIDAIGPIEEEKISVPLTKLPPLAEISNAGPSQPSEPHIQGSTPNVPPVADLVP